MPAPDWSTWRPASCVPHCFHEAPRDGVIRQPANTVSSLAFVLVALWVARSTRRLPARDRATLRAAAPSATRPPLAQIGWMRTAVIIALVVTGLGSAFFHASLTFVGQTVDVAGMYLLATIVVVYARLAPTADGARRARREWLVLNGVLLLALVTVPALRRWLFAVLLLGGVALEWQRCRRDGRPRTALGQSVGLLLVALAVWVLDQVAWPFAPTSPWQGHALWHLLTALAAGALWRHYAAPPAPSMQLVSPTSATA